MHTSRLDDADVRVSRRDSVF